MVLSLKNRIVNEFEEVISLGKDANTGVETIYAMTKDGRCPFLKPNNTCNIYDRRPKICREFGISDIKLLQCDLLYGREPKKISPAEAAYSLAGSLGCGENGEIDFLKLMNLMR